MTDLDITREFGQWSIVESDYVAQEDGEITLAKYSRCRTVYHHNDIQQPIDFRKPWTFVETADGRRGFCPSCIAISHTSGFRNMFWAAGHGKYAGYEYSFDSYNTRWARCGMTGTGVSELRTNWGSGGHNVYPDMFKSGYVKQDVKCDKCKLIKPPEQYSRHQYNLKNSVCADCVDALGACSHEQCTCTRSFENWSLCQYCIKRAMHVSASAHNRAIKEATKISPSETTRPSSARLEYEDGRIVGVL